MEKILNVPKMIINPSKNAVDIGISSSVYKIFCTLEWLNSQSGLNLLCGRGFIAWKGERKFYAVHDGSRTPSLRNERI